MKKINEMCIFANCGTNWGMAGDDHALFICVEEFFNWPLNFQYN